MKQIPLTQGKFALVDDEYYDFLNQWKWYALFGNHTKTYYAVRTFIIDGVKKTIGMHRMIMGVSNSKIFVDHRDHDTLNNQTSNLRIATPSQNQSNRNSQRNSSSKYLGVSWRKQTRRWEVKIKNKPIGYFKSEEEAALAYDSAAIKVHGEFANLNFKTA